MMDKKKYLAPYDITMGQFSVVIRKRLELNKEEALFFFINDTVIPPQNVMMNQIYKEHKDKDGFLYITVQKESTFG